MKKTLERWKLVHTEVVDTPDGRSYRIEVFSEPPPTRSSNNKPEWRADIYHTINGKWLSHDVIEPQFGTENKIVNLALDRINKLK